MTPMRRVLVTHSHRLLRSRWLLAYAGILALMSTLFLRFGGSGERALISLASMLLLVVPLVSVVFGALTVYQNRELTEMLLVQPVERSTVFWAQYVALLVSQLLALVVGVGVPLAAQLIGEGATRSLLTILLVSAGLTAAFSAVAVAIATRVEDRTRGFGAALVVWLGCTLAYDALVLVLITSVSRVSMQWPVVILSALNPVDVARLAILTALDATSLLNLTGAVFAKATAGAASLPSLLLVFALTTAVPLLAARRWHQRKDY